MFVNSTWVLVLNPHKIPYITDPFLCIETIKENLHGYKKRETIKDKLKKLDNATNEDETSAIWKEICATSEEIEATEKRMERNKLKKIKVKIVCCIGDILQGSSLMILMLRSDLRIRGLLSLTKMATNIGVDPSKLCFLFISFTENFSQMSSYSTCFFCGTCSARR